MNLKVFLPAISNSPCRTLFGIVNNVEILPTKLLVPVLTGDGRYLYPLANGSKIAYLVFGTLLNEVTQVAKDNGTTVIDMRFVKPIDEKRIIAICQTHEYVFTVEDNVILGGAGSAVNEVVNKNKLTKNIVNIGVPDNVVPHGNQNEILSDLGLDAKGILKITNDHIRKAGNLKKVNIQKGN